MSSPAHSVTSADEEAKEFAELKAKHEAELREAAEKKARRDQERQERREREKHEKKEWEEREAREEITRRIREVGEAVAEVARGITETESEQAEREREALCRVRENGVTVSLVVSAGEGPKVAEPEEDSEGDEQGAPSQRSPRWQVIRSCPNTAEVVIMRPAAKQRSPGVSGETGEVSPRVPDLARILTLP